MQTSHTHTHTQGPWFVRTGSPNGVAVHWSVDGQICPLRWTDGMRPEVEARVMADARLIAAAPELLDCLKELLCASGVTTKLQEARTRAEAVIAKAEGT